MKITIDLSTLGNIAEINQELDSLDNDLRELITKLSSAKQSANESLALQLVTILERAKSVPQSDNSELEILVKRYAEQFAIEYTETRIAPQRKAIGERIQKIETMLRNGVPYARRSVLVDDTERRIAAKNRALVTDIQELVSQAIDSAFNPEPEKV